MQCPRPQGPSVLSGSQACTPWEAGGQSHRRIRHRLTAGLWGRRGPLGVVQARLFHALPLTLARSESSLLGVAEGLDMAFVSVQGWSSFATGASKFASAAKEGVSSRPHV